MRIDPLNFEGFNRVLTGVVVPRPIAFVSTMSPDGVVNLAPYSFFNAVSYDPPTIVFSSSRRAGYKSKDTLRNIEETGEFVVNIVVDPIAEAMNKTSAEFPEDVDEFEIAGLTQAPSETVKAPRVAESPVNMECKLEQVVRVRRPCPRFGHRHHPVDARPGRRHRGPPHQSGEAHGHRPYGGQHVLPHR